MAAATVVRAPSPPVPSGGTVRARLKWLLALRTAIITVLLVTTVSLRLTAEQSLFGTAVVVLYGVCVASYLTILVGALWIRRFEDRGVVPLSYIQLMSDAGVATVLVLATGGHESAFAFLFSLTILNAAAVLERRGALILAAINTLLYIGLALLQSHGDLAFFNLPEVSVVAVFPSILANVLAFFLVAVLASTLTGQLRRTSEQLSEAKESLQEFEALHEAMLESLPSGVLSVDRDGRVLFVNRAGAEILGRPSSSLVGSGVAELLPRLPIDDAGDKRFEIDLNGGARVIGGNVAGLRGIGRVVVFQDLSELRRLQAAVARADRLQTVGRFAAGLAHEIRNPLAAMIGCLQLLEADAIKGAEDDENVRMLHIVQREAQRLSQLVTDFLTYARPSPPSIRDVALGDLLQDVVGTLNRSEQTPTVDLEVVASSKVRCDSDQLRQVIYNLVGNARQAVGSRSPDEGPPRVKVIVDVADGFGVIHVDDNGPGIPSDLIGRIFEPFFTTRPDGTGLGLATSHQLVTSQDGQLDLATSPWGGARFTIRLPLPEQRSA